VVIRAAACPGFFEKIRYHTPQTEGGGRFCGHIPNEAVRVLDLGTGDGRSLRRPMNKRPDIHAVAMDISPLIPESVKINFADGPNIQTIEHDLNNPLPIIGYFDAGIYGFTTHHLSHERKRSLYQ
jgi:tRNA (cmo5U34)-methyltransferase